MIQIYLESEIQEAEGHEFQIENARIRVLRWQGLLTLIQCSNHMALFEPDTGECVSGPCVGSTLTRLPARIENNKVSVSLKP